MAEVAAAPAPHQAGGKENPKVEEHIPEIIEERRKDAEGRILAYRYARGKLLGKVSRATQVPVCTKHSSRLV